MFHFPAVGTLVPHADGAGNDVLAGRYLQLALIFCSITSIPTILVWSHNVGVAVLWFGFDEETATLSQRLAYSMLVIVFVRSIDHGIHQFLNVTGHEKYSTIVQILHYTIQSVSIVGAVSLGIKDLMYVGLIQALLGVLLSLASFTFILLRGWTDKYWEGFAQTLSLRVSHLERYERKLCCDCLQLCKSMSTGLLGWSGTSQHDDHRHSTLGFVVFDLWGGEC